MKSPPATILFLAANPADTTALHLDQESRAVVTALRGAKHRAAFRIEHRRAATSHRAPGHSGRRAEQINPRMAAPPHSISAPPRASTLNISLNISRATLALPRVRPYALSRSPKNHSHSDHLT